jgi:hypothetical protein
VASGRERYERIAMDSKGNLRDAWNRFVKGFQVVEDYKSNITQSDRIISRGELKTLLQNNVCEIVFVRRRPERAPVPPRMEIRRMICTNSFSLLTSYNAKISLNFRLPRTGRRIDENRHDIVVVWDIFEQDYRNVSMSTPESPFTNKGPSHGTCYLRQTIPADDTFWKYYNDVLLKMTPEQKRNFEDSVSNG